MRSSTHCWSGTRRNPAEVEEKWANVKKKFHALDLDMLLKTVEGAVEGIGELNFSSEDPPPLEKKPKLMTGGEEIDETAREDIDEEIAKAIDDLTLKDVSHGENEDSRSASRGDNVAVAGEVAKNEDEVEGAQDSEDDGEDVEMTEK